MTYKTQGIILRYTDLGERDRLITIYTKDFGKIQARAKAAKISSSKLAGHLEPFTLSQLVLAQGKFLDIVTDALAINNFKILRSSLGGLAAAIYACELVDRLTGENIKNERIFHLLLKALKFFDREPSIRGAQLERLQFLLGLRVLVLLGFAPEKEEALRDPESLRKTFNYYLQFAPEQEIKSLEFLRVVGFKGIG